MRIVFDRFVAQLEAAATWPVRKGSANPPADSPPLMVVYPHSERFPPDGTYGQPRADRDPQIDVVCVGSSPEQMLWLSDRLVSVVDGFTVPDVIPSDDGLPDVTVGWWDVDTTGPVTRDNDQSPPEWVRTVYVVALSTVHAA
ncbi:MAG: hypothetical protein GEU73_07640 [Chloroflexi bacterium]|nr:hypothetical protein [Chloroflexota bacterium]